MGSRTVADLKCGHSAAVSKTVGGDTTTTASTEFGIFRQDPRTATYKVIRSLSQKIACGRCRASLSPIGLQTSAKLVVPAGQLVDWCIPFCTQTEVNRAGPPLSLPTQPSCGIARRVTAALLHRAMHPLRKCQAVATRTRPAGPVGEHQGVGGSDALTRRRIRRRIARHNGRSGGSRSSHRMRLWCACRMTRRPSRSAGSASA